MIETHEMLVLKTAEGGDIKLEVNWSEEADVSEAKMIRLHVGESTFTIKRDDLVGMLMVIGDAKSQKKLMPVSVKNVKKLERRLTIDVKLRKDMRAGELLRVVVPWIDEVPTEEELMAGNLNKRKPKLYGTK